jgi:glutaredoxin
MLLLLTKEGCPDCEVLTDYLTEREVVYKKYKMKKFPILINTNNEIIGEGLTAILREYGEL